MEEFCNDEVLPTAYKERLELSCHELKAIQGGGQ